MTFNFRIFSAQAVPFDVNQGPLGRANAHRSRLVAHWVRGADGHLECRWNKAPA